VRINQLISSIHHHYSKIIQNQFKISNLLQFRIQPPHYTIRFLTPILEVQSSTSTLLSFVKETEEKEQVLEPESELIIDEKRAQEDLVTRKKRKSKNSVNKKKNGNVLTPVPVTSSHPQFSLNHTLDNMEFTLRTFIQSSNINKSLNIEEPKQEPEDTRQEIKKVKEEPKEEVKAESSFIVESRQDLDLKSSLEQRKENKDKGFDWVALWKKEKTHFILERKAKAKTMKRPIIDKNLLPSIHHLMKIKRQSVLWMKDAGDFENSEDAYYWMHAWETVSFLLRLQYDREENFDLVRYEEGVAKLGKLTWDWESWRDSRDNEQDKS